MLVRGTYKCTWCPQDNAFSSTSRAATIKPTDSSTNDRQPGTKCHLSYFLLAI